MHVLVESNVSDPGVKAVLDEIALAGRPATRIERTMGHLTDGERARILGLNAARMFKFDIPDRYPNHDDAQAVAEQVRSEK